MGEEIVEEGPKCWMREWHREKKLEILFDPEPGTSYMGTGT